MLFFPLVAVGVVVYAGIKIHLENKQLPPALSDSFPTEGRNLEPLQSSTQVSTEQEGEINRNLQLSLGALALNIGGLFGFQTLSILSFPMLIYLFIPFIRAGYEEIAKKNRIGAGVLDSVCAFSVLSLGLMFPASLVFSVFYVSQKLILKTRSQLNRNLTHIFKEIPHTAWVIREDVEIQLPVKELHHNDIIVVSAGEIIPVDGTIVKGYAIVDQHALTGESIPAEKEIGHSVFAATAIITGRIYIKTRQMGNETVAAKIAEVLNRTTTHKTDLETHGEEIANKSAIPTLAIAAITVPILGPISATAVLMASFGYNMRLIAPISMLNFQTISLNQGILVKDGRVLEQLPKVDTVVFDKTGTLTCDLLHVGKIHCFASLNEEDILRYTAAAEYRQTHPIAVAIKEAAQNFELTLPLVDESSYEMGMGVRACIESKHVMVGSLRFMTHESVAIPEKVKEIQLHCHQLGNSLLCVTLDQQLVGAIELHPVIRLEAKEVVAQLHQRGLKTYIISGDHKNPTHHLARELGIDSYFAEVLPEEKAKFIHQLQQEGKKVCFIGDGINDSIALKQADIAISLRGASTIATDTAQAILLSGNLQHLPELFTTADQMERNLKQNLTMTIVPGVICVAGVYLLNFGMIGVTMLYAAGLAAGLTNAIRPLVQSRLSNAMDTSPS